MGSVELFKLNNNIFKVLWPYKERIIHKELNCSKHILDKMVQKFKFVGWTWK